MYSTALNEKGMAALCLTGRASACLLCPPEETKMAKAHDGAPSRSKVPNIIPEKSLAQKAAKRGLSVSGSGKFTPKIYEMAEDLA